MWPKLHVSRRLVVPACALALLALASVVRAQAPPPPPDLPPHVVKVTPAENTLDVDPALTEISVTFDQPMTTARSWSWMMLRSWGLYPGVRGGPEPTWDPTGTTCTLPVQLTANRVFAVGCNAVGYTGFRGANNLPAVNFSWAFATGGFEAQDLPPRVVATEPKNGAFDVPPGPFTVSVTFDRPMMKENAWSWVLQRESGQYPRDGGTPFWDEEGKTCGMAVNLAPDTAYALSFNGLGRGREYTGFRDTKNRPALPYGLCFKTGH